jgi:heme O synthase-like polyprenyltransferase
MTAVPNATWSGWRAHLVACMLAAAALTAFLMHLGAADPWIGGIAVPAMVWFTWVAVDIVRASRRRARERRAAQR